MKSPVGVAWLSSALAVAALAGCPAPPQLQSTPTAPPKTFTASRIRSFADSFPVTAIADSATTLFVGTTHGLIRWEGGRYNVLTQKDGLPADRITAVAVDGGGAVWLATARGLSRGLRNVWSNYAPAPVGGFLTGLIPSSDGKTVWAGGPEGLARLRSGRWERFFADTGVTALAPGPGGTVWVGTSGAGVLRIARGGDRLERFGPGHGCETDVVRGLVAVAETVLVVGEGQGGPRAALFDGQRFHSYTLTAPSVLEWAARAGAKTLLGAGDRAYELVRGEPSPAAPVKLTPLPAAASPAAPPRPIALKADAPSSLLDDGATPAKAAAAPVAALPGAVAPALSAVESAVRLPDGITTVAGSERGLLVGTRFLGASRVENDVPRLFRVDDLAANAVRLTVACIKGGGDCFFATGATRAWRFDGQAFDVANIDPEPGSRVLAVVIDGHGDVLAIHRGAEDRALRISRVEDNRWTPVGIQAVQVPVGAPELNFAAFAPDGHLWVGLRYIDKDGDARDFGAHEIALDSGKVFSHREIPTDVVAMFFRARNEAWFATRSGAARLLDGKVRVFTENDGMESDITRDIAPGADGNVLVATGRGTGRFDGARWTFPRLGAFYHRANALAHDAHGNVFIGTDKGLFCVGACAPDAIDTRRGLLADDVVDLSVDSRNRVWVLTAKGINIVEP
jgi:hypothetical protein